MSTTTGARLSFLSGLSGVPAYQHLRQIAGFYGVAAAMLVAFSGYPTAPAWVHLYPEEVQSSDLGGSPSGRVSLDREKRKRLVDEVLSGQPLPASDLDVINRSLNAFLQAGQPTDDAAGRESIRIFLDATVQRLQRVDMQRRMDVRQFAQDQLDVIEQQRIDNRRRAVILVALMMLS